jgi:hypothetical protein
MVKKLVGVRGDGQPAKKPDNNDKNTEAFNTVAIKW